MVAFRYALCALVLGLALSGCGPELAPGELGRLRYVGNVRGETPALPLVPPISDRDGNAYVLYGDVGVLETELFVGLAAGGWTGGCTRTEGTQFGVHGFVGRSQNRAWYWSGEALVAVTPEVGTCSRVLETDPSSGAALNFRAIVPWVRETPSRTTTLAWIQAFTDPVPFQVVVDLNRNIYTSLDRFSPGNATEIAVLGTGGVLDHNEGVFVVRYLADGVLRAEARFVDHDGKELATVGLSGLDTLPPYGFVGYLQGNATGLYAGLDVEGQLLVFDKSGGKRKGVGGMIPVGVHEWGGRLFVVGLSDGGVPLVAEIDDDGGVGDVRTWDAARAALDNLGGEVEVVDDRSLPSRDTTWKGPRSAIGSRFFVSPHRLDYYADGVTTWLVAGPSFGQAQGNPQTAIAWLPVGISYD